MSVKGVRSSSVLTGTGLGASPMALSDATIATYQMIHMAQSPHEPANPPLQAPRLKLLAPRAVKLGLVPSVQMEILEV